MDGSSGALEAMAVDGKMDPGGEGGSKSGRMDEDE